MGAGGSQTPSNSVLAEKFDKKAITVHQALGGARHLFQQCLVAEFEEGKYMYSASPSEREKRSKYLNLFTFRISLLPLPFFSDRMCHNSLPPLKGRLMHLAILQFYYCFSMGLFLDLRLISCKKMLNALLVKCRCYILNMGRVQYLYR